MQSKQMLSEWKKGMMMENRPKGQSGTVKINSALHTYVVVLLSQRRISQTLAARICGCSVQFFNAVIFGRRRSAEVQRRIAVDLLGFRSWDQLEWHALAFQNRIAETGKGGSEDAV